MRSERRGYRTRRAVLVVSAVLGTIAVVHALFFDGAEPPQSLSKALLPGALTIVALWEYVRGAKTDLFLLFIFGMYWIAGILEAVTGSDLTRLDGTTNLTMLILVAVAYVVTRERQTRGTVIGLGAASSLFSLVLVVSSDFTSAEAVGIMLLGTGGQALTLWLVYALIESLGQSSELQMRHAQVQRALAGCSQALLSRGNPSPLEAALKALLDATEADYAYVDINRTQPDGTITWEIVADAVGDDYPAEQALYSKGDYEGLEFLLEKMKNREPARVIVTDLPEPVRSAYWAEGIKAELSAPIYIGDRWVGSLGYTDHRREGAWTEVEEEGLRTAADMVAAYWEREAAREGLMELAQAKDRFIATVSHELRTPLTAVVGFAAELIERSDSLSTGEVSELASLIHDQSVEVSQLVDDLLTAERAATGNLTVKPAELKLLEECHELVASTTARTATEVTGYESVAWADGLRTRQIVRNLLTNAVKYGGDSIVVEVGSNDKLASVRVKDNGLGVQGIDEERIFDPYYRAQEGDTKPDSVGLGLAVSRQLALLMEGNLVYARSEGWTTFELTLPLASAR